MGKSIIDHRLRKKTTDTMAGMRSNEDDVSAKQLRVAKDHLGVRGKDVVEEDLRYNGGEYKNGEN